MSLEVGPKRVAAIANLRAGAALALVLAAVDLTPAFAQSAPENVAPSADDKTAAPADEPQTRTVSAADDQEAGERNRVYVFGRRVQSSVATIDAENAPQVVNVISSETLAERRVVINDQQRAFGFGKALKPYRETFGRPCPAWSIGSVHRIASVAVRFAPPSARHAPRRWADELLLTFPDWHDSKKWQHARRHQVDFRR